MKCDTELYTGDRIRMIKLHTAKDTRLPLLGAWVQILHA